MTEYRDLDTEVSDELVSLTEKQRAELHDIMRLAAIQVGRIMEVNPRTVNMLLTLSVPALAVRRFE